MLLIARSAEGGNLLVNPSFEANSGHAVATGWTYFSPPTPANYFGDYWVESNVPAQAGTLYWKQWGALYNAAVTNVAGIYQDFGSAPGSTYQAGGWMFTKGNDLMGPDCLAWIEISFLSASSNLLALYKSANFTANVGADAWFEHRVTNVCDLSSPVSLGDPYFTTYAVTGSVSQLVAPLGTSKVRCRLAFAQAGNQGGSCYFDNATLNQISGPIPPVISSLFPFNMIFVNPGDGLTFNASSPSGFAINNSDIHVTLNGADVSGSLVISGSASSKNVAFHGLQSNLVYNASITVRDAFNLSVSAGTYFETTWVGIEPIVYLWEAEDFDFDHGMFMNNPDLCSAGGDANCYFGKTGVEGVDEHNLNGGGSHLYRPGDPMGTGVSGDYQRKNLVLANRLDYKIDPFNFSEWVNYTRTWPNTTNWVIARLATDIGLSGTLTLSTVNPDGSTTDLGTFTVASGRGWTTFDNVYLMDANGYRANVVLNGNSTLRVTSGGNLLPGCFMLVAAQVDLPQLSGLSPGGTRPFEAGNPLSFSVASIGATFPTDGIKLNLDGVDASGGLLITGSASTKDVVFPALQSNAVHRAIITVTNSLGHGVSVTNQFDTFSQDNFMVEAEDFDFGGGQYITAANWSPDGYQGLGAATNIDFQHTLVDGEQFNYRADGIPESLVQHYLVEARQKFIDVGGNDYQLDWFGVGDWANYTRDYPEGHYYVYMRASGLVGSAYSMDLNRVVSGVGTTNQVTSRLGHWSALGRGKQNYDWLPLTDDSLMAPAIMKLGGVSTLRLSTSTGLCYPNYFMLVPASGIILAATASAGNVSLVFPTQAGATYRVFSRVNLATGNWVLMTTVLGDGAAKSVNSPATGGQRFYQVTSP